MPLTPTPCVNGHVVGSPAAQASMSISSLAPATTVFALVGSTAIVGSFCLFWENGVGGLPFETSTSDPNALLAGISRNRTDSPIDSAMFLPPYDPPTIHASTSVTRGPTLNSYYAGGWGESGPIRGPGRLVSRSARG